MLKRLRADSRFAVEGVDVSSEMLNLARKTHPYLIFPYSTTGINENLKLLIANNCKPQHLELDQHPEKHVYIIAQKMDDAQL